MTACSNCRHRRKKCDGRRPSCIACRRLGLSCPGYQKPLRWVSGAASRGRFAPAAQSLSCKTSVPDVPDAVGRSHRSGDDPSQPKRTDVTLSGDPDVFASRREPTIDALTPVTMSDTLSGVRVTFRRFLTSGLLRLHKMGSHQWVQDLVQGLATQSQALLFISASIQRAFDDEGPNFSVSTLEHLDLALITLRSEIAYSQGALGAGTLTAGVFICTFHFLQGWPCTHHLRLIYEAYCLQPSTELPALGVEEDSATRSALESLGVMDLPPFVLGRNGPVIGIWKSLRKAQDTWKQGRLGGVEPVTGIPRSLLDVFACMLDEPGSDVTFRFWTWPGEAGDYVQGQLWDCWRLSGILDMRRRRRNAHSSFMAQAHVKEPQDFVPETCIILSRLMEAIEALHKLFRTPWPGNLLLYNGLVYPLVTASLEIFHLKRHPEWKRTLDEVRHYVEENSHFELAKIAFRLLDDAWQEDSSNFDVDSEARRRGVEIAIL